MVCPECQNKEIGAAGVCSVCGHIASGDTASPESKPADNETQSISGSIKTDNAEGVQEAAEQDDQPQWRRDLSQRLHAIKEKRETREAKDASRRNQGREKDSSLSAPRAQTGRPQIIAPATFLEGAPPPKPAPKPRGPLPRQKTLQPLSHESTVAKPSVEIQDTKAVQVMIDNAVSGRVSKTNNAGFSKGLFESDSDMSSEDEGKLILLSRTLSGLVDLIIVLVCSGVCIIAADFFSGIIELDTLSYLAFSILFLLIYFLYSLFFLTAASQTIGMMITDLRVINVREGRPSFRQLLRRCGGYLVSLLGLGFGLIWSLFDRDSLCFHDRVSGTQVIRG